MANSRIFALRNVPQFLFNLVLPDDCRLCAQPLVNVSRIPVCKSCLSLPQPLQAEFFCQTCRTPFLSSYPLDHNGQCAVCRENAVNFDFAYSFGSYEGPLRKLIQLFKYGKIESLAGPLSALLLRAVPRDQNFDVIAAMPMHWRKQWERGFNQAELLAQPVARRYGLKLATNLRRKRYTVSQAGLSEAGRRQNLKGSFAVGRPEQIAGKRVLLIDDVFTTGATLRAATAALKSAGVAKVSALTLARVDGRAPAAMNLDTDFSSTGLAPLGSALAENDARRRVSAGAGIS
ncbi:MAG TPA: ComF family protein [Terracidiphilus sp.]